MRGYLQHGGRTKVVEARGLTKHYGSFVAADAVDFSVYRGDVFGFLGPNGAGKSTTIGMLLGLIAPTRGEVSLFGLPPSQLNVGLANVGGIIESPAFYPYLSGHDNLKALASLRPGTTPKRIDEVLEIVGLTDAAGRSFGKYSMGMKQRLGIAWTLLHDPELLILDEPTNGLDPSGTIEVRQLILSLAEQGKTIIISSHLLHEIEKVCDRIAVIQHGKIVAEGEINELMNSSQRIVIRTPDLVRAKAAIKLLPGIAAVAVEDDLIRVDAPGVSSAAINRELVNAGVLVEEIRIDRATLEDTFLQLTSTVQEVEVAA